MRDIKFRAWDKKKNRWFDEKDEYVVMFTNGELGLFDYSGMTTNEDYTGKDALEISLYTGLKDKNGVEIYEGDVVRVESFYGLRDGRIVWDEQKCMFFIASLDSDDATSFIDRSPNTCEVVGNIYENPEILTALEK